MDLEEKIKNSDWWQEAACRPDRHYDPDTGIFLTNHLESVHDNLKYLDDDLSIHDYYQFIDARMGRLLDLLSSDTDVILMSDHGAKAMQGGICINDWLIEQGDLVLIDRPPGISSLDRRL